MIPVIEASPEEIYDIELEHTLLEANEKIAVENRAQLDAHGITAIDFMGAIGSGKTNLITRLIEHLKDRIGIAVFNGDATISEDQEAVQATGVQVVQLATINGCHLDANLVQKALGHIELDGLGLLFLENIGNLICPAEFPLGAKARIVTISVTEGPWCVRKHPHMFLGADLVVINKMDLAQAMEVDADAIARDVEKLKPGLPVLQVSCRDDKGIDAVAERVLAFGGHA